MAITDYKACWSCLKKTMLECPELGKGWFKCSECGATWVEMPKLTAPILMAGTYDTVTGRHHAPRIVAKKVKAKK